MDEFVLVGFAEQGGRPDGEQTGDAGAQPRRTRRTRRGEAPVASGSRSSTTTQRQSDRPPTTARAPGLEDRRGSGPNTGHRAHGRPVPGAPPTEDSSPVLLLCSIPPGRQSTGPDDYSHRNRPPERTQRLMSIWPSIVAVLGTLAGALTAGLLQHRSARTARAEERAHNHRQDQLGAVTDFAAALDAYRSAIFHRERLALTEAGTEHQLEGRPRSGLPAGRSAPPCRCGCGSRLHRLRRATEVPHRTLFTLPWLWQLRWRVPHGGLSWPPRSGGSLRGWA